MLYIEDEGIFYIANVDDCLSFFKNIGTLARSLHREHFLIFFFIAQTILILSTIIIELNITPFTLQNGTEVHSTTKINQVLNTDSVSGVKIAIICKVHVIF